jgi:cysteine-rich repeat protein
MPTPAPTSCPNSTVPSNCCGNGIVERGEECDLGLQNDNIFGACTKSCTLPRCGDGIIHKCNTSNCPDCECEEEQCDDGNTLDGDGCDRHCRFENYFNTVPGSGNSMISSTSSVTQLFSYKHLDEENAEVHVCQSLQCLTPGIDQLLVLPNNEFNLVYWIHNYCSCLSK